MTDLPYRSALIVGAGAGLSASLARKLSKAGLKVALAARKTDKLKALAGETGASLHSVDAGEKASVDELFAAVGTPEVVIYNPSYRSRGPFTELDAAEVEKSIRITAFGGFLVAQAAAKRMLPNRHGAIVFTGASASVKGYAQSAPFAMGKFALRGLAQSMARELSPQGIHIGHVVIDGGISSATRPVPNEAPDSLLDPDAIADTYLHLLAQPRSAWSWEVEVRPWVERF